EAEGDFLESGRGLFDGHAAVADAAAKAAEGWGLGRGVEVIDGQAVLVAPDPEDVLVGEELGELLAGLGEGFVGEGGIVLVVAEDDGGLWTLLRAYVGAEPVELGGFEAAVAADGFDGAETGDGPEDGNAGGVVAGVEADDAPVVGLEAEVAGALLLAGRGEGADRAARELDGSLAGALDAEEVFVDLDLVADVIDVAEMDGVVGM